MTKPVDRDLAVCTDKAIWQSLLLAMKYHEAGDEEESARWIKQADKLESRYKTDYGVHYLDVIAQPINGANAGC